MKYLAILLCILSIMAFADSSYHDEENSRFPMDLHDLKLTAKQHKSIETAMKEYQIAYRNNHLKNKTLEQEIDALFLAPTFNPDEFTSKNIQLQKTSIEIRTQLFLKLHKILTPEQKRRFITHLQEWDSE